MKLKKLKPAVGTIAFLILAIVPTILTIITALLGGLFVWICLGLFTFLRWLDTNLCEYDDGVERMKRGERNEADL